MNNDTIPYYKCCDVDMFHIVMDKKRESSVAVFIQLGIGWWSFWWLADVTVDDWLRL